MDIVPCGGIESPQGRLSIRGSDRVLNTAGLLECFELGWSLDDRTPEVVVPPPAGFILLKLLSFADRRAPRDLRDLGHVLYGYPVVDDAIWADDALLAAFTAGDLTYDDAPFWRAGRRISSSFSVPTLAAFTAALDALLQEPPSVRALIAAEQGGLDPDLGLEGADRALRVLMRACEVA